MFKHWMEIAHNHDNDYVDWLFYKNVFSSERWLAMAKDSNLMSYLEAHLLSSDQVFLSIQSKTFSQFSDFFAFELNYSLFHILMIKSRYRVDRAFFSFLFNSFEIL